MTRSQLKPHEGRWMRWTARIIRHGRKRDSHDPRKGTVLLHDVKSTNYGGVEVDHLWLKASDKLSSIPAGSRIKFEAVVTGYRRGDAQARYADPDGLNVDYKISAPRNVIVLQ